MLFNETLESLEDDLLIATSELDGDQAEPEEAEDNDGETEEDEDADLAEEDAEEVGEEEAAA